MNKLLRPERFDPQCDSPKIAKEWTHWITTFENFISSVEEANEEGKLKLLINYVGYSVYENIVDCKTYSEAKKLLNEMFVKPKNEMFARYCLTSRRQQPGETIDHFIHALRQLGKDCNFKPVSADENRDDYIRDSFISGLSSVQIRQRLLENNTLTLHEAISQAQSLESAQKHSEAYVSPTSFVNATPSSSKNDLPELDEQTTASTINKILLIKALFLEVIHYRDTDCFVKN